MQVNVKAPKADGRSITVTADIPEGLQELVDKYGEPVVVDAAVRSLKIQFQAYIRALLEAGTPDDEIEAKAAEWVPGTKRDSFAGTLAKVKSLSPEKRAALLEALGIS